jgi:hypothetical protein
MKETPQQVIVRKGQEYSISRIRPEQIRTFPNKDGLASGHSIIRSDNIRMFQNKVRIATGHFKRRNRTRILQNEVRMASGFFRLRFSDQDIRE